MKTSPGLKEIRLAVDLGRQHHRMRALLEAVGVRSRCPACDRHIFWVFHVHEKRSVPYDGDGESHYVSCPKGEILRCYFSSRVSYTPPRERDLAGQGPTSAG